MHKGITLQVWVKVEGEQEAPDDFAALATEAVQRVLTAGAQQDASGLSFEIVRTTADDDPPDDENEQHA